MPKVPLPVLNVTHKFENSATFIYTYVPYYLFMLLLNVLPSFFSLAAVLCVISERGGGMGEADRLCFERYECYMSHSRLIYNRISQTKPMNRIPLRVDMTGIIPEEDEEEHELYDDVGQMDEIYEVLPGLIRHDNIRSYWFGRHFIDQF